MGTANTIVQIREHIPDDLAAFLDWQTDPEVGQHLSWLPRTRADAVSRFKATLEQRAASPRTEFFYAVVLEATDEVVGDVGLTIDEPGSGRCGWFIRRRFWNRGYATQAVRLLAETAFSTLSLQSLSASCRISNAASRRIMEKSGFVLEDQSDTRLWFRLARSDCATGR